ncbi:MAG: N-acetyltransferase [Cytophagales bacterium]|nr:MAG: N-acetyltransferase [Cytophagales bacterium]
MNPNIEIVEAGEEYLTEAAKLFDAYRVFYEQNSDIEAVTQFLKARILQKESVLFLARYENEYVGFTQLYPSFTSVGLAPIWILNDLYVAETHRQKGIAQQLIETAANYARKTNRKKLRLAKFS